MKRDTELINIGRPHSGTRSVNPKLNRASTILAGTAEELYNRPDGTPLYGRFGNDGQNALREALCSMVQADYCALAPSGLSAMTLPVIASCRAGDHILAADCIYGPTRMFLQETAVRWGMEVELFNPRIGSDIGQLFKPNTKLIVCETPGSLTLELQDIPAISAKAKMAGVKIMVDDTWSAGLNANMLDLGADFAAQSLTKYFGGHSDMIMGAVTARGAAATDIKHAEWRMGLCVSADDAFLALRGLRTLSLRMRQSAKSSLELARRFEGRNEVERIIHPALPNHPDYNIFTRDFTGSAGLFTVIFKDWDQPRSLKFLNALAVFGLGFSWGGYESLAIHCDPQLKRQYNPGYKGAMIRFAIGLEDVDDLWGDIEMALEVCR